VAGSNPHAHMRVVQNAAFVLAAFLLLSVPLALASDDPCYVAYGDGTKTREFEICAARAKSVNADSEFQYGLILFSGENRKNDHAAGLDWIRKSARQGHRLARISLGGFLSHREIEQSLRNVPEAFAWFTVAGARESASKLKLQMNQREFEQAEKLVTEFRAKYGETTGIVN
jgi:TPR repeat protein